MRIRDASEDDLERLGGIQEAAKSFLAHRYQPDALDVGPGDPGAFIRLGRHLLATGGILVAEDPEPVGFSAHIVRDGVWLLSQLWVDPEHHGRGIGSALLDGSLERGHGASRFAVVSSPSPTAFSLYLRRSMVPVCPHYQFEVRAEPPTGDDAGEPMTADDDGWIAELDREVVGWARPEDHAFWREHARGFVLRRGGRPLGYGYAGPEMRVGPIAGHDAADLPRLLDVARRATGGDAWLVIPAPNRAALLEAARLRARLLWINTFMASRPLGDGSRYLSAGGALV